MDNFAVVPLVIVATWSAARHASKVGLQRSALANNSIFSSLPLTYCKLSPNQVDPLLLDPGQLHITRLTPLQNMKYIQIKFKIHQERKHSVPVDMFHAIWKPRAVCRLHGSHAVCRLRGHRLNELHARVCFGEITSA